jgi:L-threonylcarbamoyladenylate synthase
VSPTTHVLTVDPDDPASDRLEAAAAVLKGGGLVAFATETVYGLGADATNPEAVARIFAAKGRPSFNPLIVHAHDPAMARTCVAGWPEAAGLLADAFWPGPLTLVLPRSGMIPDLVTAGRDTVGVRVPAPNVARRLIAHAGRPIAAPSANRSTGISPTLARHVLDDLDGRIDLILDSGPTTVGLESTVLDLTTVNPRILRPGPITAAQLEHALAGRHVPIHVQARNHPDSRGPLTSPGQMAVHYAPRTRAVRVDRVDDLARVPWPARAALVVVGQHTLPTLPSAIETFELPTPDRAAQELYAVLHQCDALDIDLIVVVFPPDRPEWCAVRDRLRRATIAVDFQ